MNSDNTRYRRNKVRSEEIDTLKVSKKDWDKIKGGIFAKKLKEKGYVFNRWLMLSGFFLVLLLFVLTGQSMGWGDRWQVTCPEDQVLGCVNMFYECSQGWRPECPSIEIQELVCTDDPLFCKIPLLQAGEQYGHPPSNLYNYFGLIMMLIIFETYVFNHILFNSKKQRMERLQR